VRRSVFLQAYLLRTPLGRKAQWGFVFLRSYAMVLCEGIVPRSCAKGFTPRTIMSPLQGLANGSGPTGDTYPTNGCRPLESNRQGHYKLNSCICLVRRASPLARSCRPCRARQIEVALQGIHISPMAVGHCKQRRLGSFHGPAGDTYLTNGCRPLQSKSKAIPTNPSIILLMALQGTYILPMAVGHWIAIGIGHWKAKARPLESNRQGHCR
jgi:hypothetical protein